LTVGPQCVQNVDMVVENQKIAVMLSGSGTTLQNLIDHQASGTLIGTIQLVISDNERAFGLERARGVGIESIVLTPSSFASESAYESELFERLNNANIRLVVLAGYLKKVPINSSWAGRIINIHPALLPKFGGPGMYGLKVHRQVLDAKGSISGCTVHFVDDQYDHGPIIDQGFVRVYVNDSPESLQSRVQICERALLPKAINDVLMEKVKLESNNRISRL